MAILFKGNWCTYIGTLLNDYTDENVKVLNLLLKSF